MTSNLAWLMFPINVASVCLKISGQTAGFILIFYSQLFLVHRFVSMKHISTIATFDKVIPPQGRILHLKSIDASCFAPRVELVHTVV